jgi:hypothetical protein
MTERRSTPRMRPPLTIIARVSEMGSSSSQGALLEDVGAGGAALLLSKPITSPEMMCVELPGRGDSVLARLVHSSGQTDGTWRAGVQFISPLEAGDLRILVGS